ncbi:MAG: endonuclease III [Spirochaetae bacterium HGW-Spirochaetae-9]|nr:MAG: endonuclease III [Spirochaetae bacterium HGW-Spirochaetae-9]
MAERIALVKEILLPLWPDAKPLLSSSNCFELLCAVMLSAQTTDEQVNGVTPALFARYPDVEAMAEADVRDVETLIHSVGFFHTKAKHLVATAQILQREFAGIVPWSMESLTSLPGVGRKTANLVASACFGSPGIIVDTHVMRVIFRLGLYPKKDPTAIENCLRATLAEECHTAFSHALNRHGKYLCTARTPTCLKKVDSCPLEGICPRKGVQDPGI